MKLLLCILVCLVAINAGAQTPIEKTFATKATKEVVFEFDHPSVKIQTHDKSDILIKGTVSINAGENDSAFELQSTNIDGMLVITSFIKDKDKLPRHITIKKGEQEYIFKTNNYNDPEIQKFLEQNGREYNYMSSSMLIEVKLEVFIPKNLKTTVNAKHGLVEFKSFDGPLKVDAKHGGVDATINPTVGDLVVRTRYGEILSNLDVKFEQQPMEWRQKDKWTEVAFHKGSGSSYELESKHGKVYLRKP